MTRNYVASKEDYLVWMSQPVLLGGATCPRKDFVTEFAQSIRSFMASYGYKMEDRLEKELALWMYRLHIQEVCRNKHGAPVHLPEIHHRDTQEDYDQYCLIVGEQEVKKFIDIWSDSGTDDLLEDTHAGNRIRYGFEEFLYRVINIETSKQGRFIASLWDASGSASESEMYESSKKDVYLEDATKGFHGGRGSKV
jgi:hypothetical protein